MAIKSRAPRRLLLVSWWMLVWMYCFLSCHVVGGSLFSPQDVPGPPEKVLVSSLGDSAMRVQFLPPVRTKSEGNNGAPVLGYKVEVARRVNDVHTFTVEANGPVIAGSYRLTFTNSKGTDVTACIPWNATEIMFELALEELVNVDMVSVSRSAYGVAKYGYVYTIVFSGKYLVSGQQTNVLVADQTGCQATRPLNRVLTLTGARVTAGAQGYIPEVWEIVTEDPTGANVIGGSFDLSLGFDGSWADSGITATIAAGSRTAVTSAPIIGRVNRGDAIRIGGEDFTVHMTAPFTDFSLPLDTYHIRGVSGAAIYLRDTALGDVAVTQGSQTVTTASDFRSYITIGEYIKIGKWEFKVTAVPTATSLTIGRIATTGNDNWPDASAQHITAYKRKKVTLSANAEATDVKLALNGLPGIGVVDVSRVGPTRENGYRWRVTFLSLGTKNNCPVAPCLYADKVTGTNTRLTDAYGSACATCAVTASLIVDDSNNQLSGVAGEFLTTSVVATREIGGIVDEVQQLSTSAIVDNIGGTFKVNFRNPVAQSDSATINFDDTAVDVQTKLQNIPTVGRLNVTRTGNDQFGYTWMVTFLTNVGDLPLLQLDAALLTGAGATVSVQEVQKGVDAPFEATIDGLFAGQDYYIRAFAKNVNGYGAGTDLIQREGKGALPLATRIAGTPDTTSITGAWPLSGTQLGVRFTTPEAHGSPITKYVFEYAVGNTFGVFPIKKFFILNPIENDLVGTFRLQYGDVTTPLLSIHTSASAFAAAISQLPSLRPVTVSRAAYVLTGTTATNRVKSFLANKNLLSTSPLSLIQSKMLVSGATVRVGGDTFTVKTQPATGATTVEVMPGHGVADYTADSSMIKVDPTGAELGPCGYEWTISFRNELEAVTDGGFPGFQVLSTLRSVEAGATISTFGFSDQQVAQPVTYYGAFDISNDDRVCDTYVVGAPSAVQILQLYASTTITGGGFQLQLGQETTACITLGTLATKSTIQTALRALNYVDRVSVEEHRVFKVLLLSGSSTSKVTDYLSAQNKITVTTALVAQDAAALGVGTLIQVSRNPNDFTRHSCEFRVTAPAASGDTEIAVAVSTGTCADFAAESRALRILDFHDYKIRFWGQYPTGQWPTLKVVSGAFGVAPCPVWAPAVPVYSSIHTLKYEGVCANGRRGTQTILADASSEIGGFFTLSYLGKETSALGFQTTTAATMRSAIDSITEPGKVNVTLTQYGVYGKAWRITFMSDGENEDTLFIKHSYLTGEDAVISVYPTIEIMSNAQRNDIRGTFRLTFAGQRTERIAYTATHAKVVQELQKLSAVDSVIALGSDGDMGVTSLLLTATATAGSALLTNIQLNGKPIDPTLFLAVREKLTIAGTPASVRSLTPTTITLKDNLVAGGAVTFNAGLITKRIKPLPGVVSINRLMRVVTATKTSTTFELPPDHGYNPLDVFYVNGAKFTVQTVNAAIVTTAETYTGDNVVGASPEVYLFDNKLRTTSDVSSLLAVNDDIWLQTTTGEMTKYTVSGTVTSRVIPVTGVFVDTIIGAKVYQVGYGRSWSLVFRSYVGKLESIDAIPQNDWRGTEARLTVRHPNAVAKRTFSIGNSPARQTVLLEATTAAAVGAGATYTLTFGDETTGNIPWTATGDALKTALEALDSIDGVTITSMTHDNGFLHTVVFWGMYTTPRLPTLVGTVTAATDATKCSVLVRDSQGGAVSETKRDHLILKSNEDFVFRLFAVNEKGISDLSSAYSTQTTTMSVIPTPPTSVSLGEYQGPTWLTVHYRPPVYTGGAEITMYRLEWDAFPTFDSASADYGVASIQKKFEVQQVLTTYRSNTNMGGTFTLAWGGRMTTSLPFDCSADQMTDALAIITDTANIAVNPVKVVRTRASWGYSWQITFLNNPGDLALLVADGTLLTGDFPRITVLEVVKGFSDLAIRDFTHEVQEIYSDAKTTLSGTFTLEFEGRITTAISVGASALEMQDALQAITTLYSIKVTRTWRSQAINTAIWTVTFAYLRGEEMVGAGNIFSIKVADTSLLGGTAATVKVANKITGSDPFRYTITGLRPGVRYYFHVMAYSAEGFGSTNSPMSSAVTCGQPDPPKSVVASVVDGTSLGVTWTASASDGGCPIDRYKVEWYRGEGTREQQTITTSASKGLPEIQSVTNFADSQSLGGYFKLSFGGETSENIAWNAPATGQGSIKERLERLSSVGTVDVSQQPSTRVVRGLMVTVTGTTVTVDASSTSTIGTSNLGVNDFIWILGTQLKITASTATTLTVDKSISVPTTVAVPVFRKAYGFQWLITFQGGHVGPQKLLKVTPSDNWAGNNPGIYVDSVQKGLQPISGTFRVSFASGGLSHITPPLPHNVTADVLKDALESLVTIGTVNVMRSTNGFGFNWLVTFTSEFKNEISLLGVDDTELHGPSVRISAARTRTGVQPVGYCEFSGVAGAPAVVQMPAALGYTIRGLTTGQGYAIRVRARNGQGYGAAAYISPSFQTPRTTPSAPVDAKLLVLSSRQLKVRWSAPLSNGGSVITSYVVQWDTSNVFLNGDSPNYDYSAVIRVQASDTGPFFYNIAISTGGTYFARVVAVNDQGRGAYSLSDPTSAIPVDRTPGQPENVKATVLSNYAILVEWDASSTQKSYYGGDGGLPITQYMVEWDSSVGFDSPASFGLVDGTKRSYIIGGNDPVTGVRSNVLIPGTTYSIRVTAFNAKGAGRPKASDPASVVAANQLPTVPRNLQLSVVSASSLKAQWDNPLYDGGASLKSYEVQWDEQGDFSSGQSKSATIPIVREMQSLTLSTDVVNEEQLIDATVEVINEVQVVRTTFTGADEIQVIQTTNNAVVDEIQTVTTSATDRDEVQELRLDGDDVNEIQAIRTTVAEVFEVQTLQVGVVRVNEIQTIALTIPGAQADATLITGHWYLSFDNTICTHCTKAVGYRRTTDLISSLTTSGDAAAALIVENALKALDNIDTVSVARTKPANNGVDLTYIYTITFTGDGVTGDVPELVVDSTFSGFPPAATQATRGNEVVFDPASQFGITHTCESYSDPYAISTFSAACTPSVAAQLCASCITIFDGTAFTIATGTTLAATVAVNDRLIAGICVFTVGAVSATSLTVLANDVGLLCSTFSDATLPLFRAVQPTTTIPVKTASNTISAGSVVENLLNTIIDSVTVVRTQSITATFVGSLYEVTFRKRSGRVPLLRCDASTIQRTNTNGAAVCTPIATTTGSMIGGKFTVSLAKESDGVAVATPDIPWDASEALMKSTLERVVVGGERVFGTVNVRRSVYSPTGNKWSGGFTWQIEFTSRGWDIPKMTVTNALVNSDSTKLQPDLLVEDATSPFNPFAGSRNGNQIAGTITFAFGGVTSQPCTIGVNTDVTNLQVSKTDAILAAFLVAQLGIPTIQITRSAATQARGFTWAITFSDPATGGDVAMLDIPATLLTGQNVRTRMFETVKGNQLGGTFQLKFNGETSGPILFSADDLAVQAQLNSLASIKPSSVLVSRTGPAISSTTQVLSYTWSITFRSSVWADPTSDHSNSIAGNWKGPRAKWDDVWPETGYSKAWGRHVGPMASKGLQVMCIKDGLTTTANDNSQSCQSAVATAGVGPILGTFTVTLNSAVAGFMSVKNTVVSTPIAHNAWATRVESGATGTSVEEILEKMENVGDVAVSRSAVNTQTGGYTWTVTFLRDANGPCEQEEPSTSGVRLCNSPGDVPAMTASLGTLAGSTPTVTVCEKTLNNCLQGVVQNGRILRGDFTTFKVTGDPGFDQRYFVTIACAGGAAPPCDPIQFFNIAPGSEDLPDHLKTKDRFTIGGYPTCIYTVVRVTTTQVEVNPSVSCPAMVAGMTNNPVSVFIRVPWNADESLVKRVLEASSDQNNEMVDPWKGGRKVSVVRTIFGKYGEVSWHVRFISNPTFTPPGAGNIRDITTVFAPNPTSPDLVSVTQVTPGSAGLSGSFLVDFHSTIGPREIMFDESEDRLQRKLNEMNTIGRVIVKKFQYPSTTTGCTESSCSGGWEDQPVGVPGTRGGYRWRVRFMKVTGEYGGLTFPSGSGNVGPLAVTLGTLQGNQRAIDLTTNLGGSSPILGGFTLNTSTKATPLLPYSASADSIKQGIESMNLFGEVDVTQEYLLMQRIPNAVATISKDGITATVAGVDDIRQSLALGDRVRFGPSSAANLVGANGDSPITGVIATSTVTVLAMSPNVRADPTATRLLFPSMNVRIDGLVYQIQRSGHEIQTVAVTLPIGSWDPNEARAYFNLKLKRGGSSQTTTACWPFNIDAATVQRDLNALLVLLIPTAQANEIKVTRSGPMSTEANARKGYVFSVYFLGPSVAGNVAILEADFSGCTAITGAQVAIAVTTEGGKIGHQRLSFATDSGQVVDPTGYFKLSLGGASTGCLKWGISASDLEAQLEGMLNTGNVLVARRGSGTSATEVQRLRMTSNSQVTTTNTGLFQLAFTVGGKTSWTTGCLAYGISAEDLQLAINQMSNIAAAVPHVTVTRDGDGTSMWGYGYEYTINFRGPIAGGYSNVLGNVAQLEVFNVGRSPCAPVVGGAPALIMETVRDGRAGYTYNIYFLNYAAAYTPQLSIQHEGNGGVCTTGWTHTGGSVREAIVDVVSLGGSSEVQTLVIKDSAAQIPTGSSYKLTFGGASTNCIVFDATASALETALVGLATIATGGVLVSRDQHPVTAPNGYIYAITFTGDLTTGDVPLLATVLNDPLCQAFAVTTQVVITEQVMGGAHPGGFVTTALYDGEQPGQHVAYAVSQVFSVLNEQIDIQQLLVTNPQSDLTVNSVYKLVVLGVTTVSIRWDASEDDMETALTVTGVNDGDIVVTRRKDAALAPNGYVYTIYFSGNTVKGNVAAITVNTKTSFGSGDVFVSTVQNGVDNAASFLTTSIPLALPSDSSTSSAYLGMDASLNVFKVNGFLWTIKFKSTIGNIPALGMRSDGLSGKFTVIDDFVPGSSSNSYVMSSLYPGINYFVHVAASTDIGTGPFTDPATKIPSGVATAVQNIAAGYALYVREVQEIRVAATHINEIQEIKTSAAIMAEVQTLRTYASADACTDGNCIGGLFAFRVPTVQTIKVSAQGPITAGSYSIRFVRYKSNGAGAFVADGTVFDTVKISWDASADDVKTAMAALDSVDASDLIVTRDGDGSSAFGYGYILSITFIGNKVAGETDKITIKDSTSGCGTCDPFVTTGNVPYAITVSMNSGQAMGTDTAVQEVIVKASKPVVSGSYRLKFTNLGAPVQSACINFDAPARGTDVRAMEGILIAMSNVDVVYVTRDLDPVRAPNGFVYQVFFYGNGVYGPMTTMEVVMCEAFKTQENNALTTNGVNGLVTVTTIDAGGITAGNTFVDAASATADQLEADLNRLPVFGDVIVTRSLVDQQGGFVWTVAFKDSEGKLPQFICAVDATFAGRTGTACETTTLTDGNALSGTFVVESSVPIAFDASGATMKAALEAMSWVGTVQVVRAGPTPQMGFTWTITFLDYVGDVPPLLITSSLVGTGSAIQVTEITKGNFIGGTFTLTYLSSTTAPIASNAKATAQDSNSDGTSLQEKLQALSIIGPTSVTRSAMDPDGGYTWLVTFLDNNLNPGDVPLLVGNATLLTGVGVVVATREIQKGSNAVGDQLWISFDPPVSDQGSPISKYVVRWDTSALFTASLSEVPITEPEKLYLVQRVMTGAPSLGWSRLKATEVAEVQTVTIANGVANGATFTLSFRGVASATLTAGVSTAADLLAALSSISTIGTVTVTPTTGLVAANAVFQVTFVDKPGDLPFLSSTPAATATITETTKGVANYRKEVIVFSCLATAGTVTFQYGTATQAIAFDATLAITKTQLETLFNVEAGGIRVLSSQSLLCAPAGPADVTIVFDRVYGDITLQTTSATVGTTVTRNTVASIDGIYNDVAAKMSGTFQVGYKGEYTRALNAESSALDMRYALEDLTTIDTVAVSREASYQALPGTVDVVNGQIFVTCSTGQTCGFLRSAYGLPGYQIRIGGTWYRVRTSPTTLDSLDATRLYLGDTNGREIGYQGETRTGVTVYEWTKGYVWAVYMLRVAQPLAYLRAKIPRLVPSDSIVMIGGSACDKCYYLPTQTTKRLTMGQEYFIDITAYNENGKGQLPVNGPIRATPSQVPNAPSNVDLVVISGKELEVFFSPPALASTNVSPNFNNDISSYIVQWDLRNDFKHGLPVCTACATALQVNALTVSQSLVTLLAVNSKFTIAAENCVLTVAAIAATRIDVSPNHGCSQFNTGAYPLYYYAYPPAILTGDQIQGSPPFRYLISNLVVSTQYYVRVAAVNSVPVQQIALSGNPPDNRKWSFPLAATTKDTVPDPPVSVYLYPFSGTTLEIQIQPPTRDGQGLGGAAITFYWIDIDTVSTFDSATKAAPVEVDVLSPDISLLYAGGPRVYYSKNLQTGVRYFVQVKAKNSIGYSRATIAPNPLAPTRSPDGPVNVKVAAVLTSPTPIDYATVTWQKPLTDGGLPVTSYKVEWWGADSRPEIQVIEIKWTAIPTTAPFRLAFGGLQTGNMPFDVAPENLRSALMNLGPTKIQHVQVTRSTVNINKGYQWRVTFQNNLNTGDQPMIQLEFGTILGGTDVTGRVFEAQSGIAVPQLNFPGKREVQVLLTSHATTTVGGYFRLSYKGSAWSNYLSATIAGADLKLALEALPTVGKVTVTSQGASTNGQIWTITFESAVGNLPALIVDSSKLTPAGAFIGVKDGDNAVDKTGARCVPGDDICSGTWSTYKTGIAAMATIGESAVAYQFYETIDATTLSYKVTGLVPGKTYYVAVTAKNALGLGSRIRSTPTTIIPPVQVPSPPSLVTVDVNPGVATQLKVTWSAPPSDGGGEVRMYRVEYDPSPLFRNRGYQDFWCPTAPTYAVWTVQTYRQGNTGKPIGNGYFNLLLTRQNLVLQTEPIPWNAVATGAEEVGDNAPALSKVFCVDCPGCTDVCQSQPAFSFGRRELSGSLQSKLEYLSTVNQVQIVRSAAAADGGYTWTITFQDIGDDFVLAPFIPGAPTLTCDDNVCNGGDYRIQTTKITNGISNPPCTGSQIIPANGALNKGQLYYVRVFSFNKIGFSLPGLAASPQKPMVVPGPPTGVTLQVLTVSELKVLFSPPDDDGGDTVVEYLVEWATNNAFTSAQSGSVVLLSGGAPYYRVISNLVKGTFYYVRVKAKNSQGYGQYQISSPTSLNPYTTPSAPTQVLIGVTSSTMLTVQWSIPDDDGGDAISGYLVQWDISAGFDSLSAEATKAKITDVTQRSYTITLLTPGTTYYVRVSAINSGGAGTPQTTTPASLVPVNTRPGKPHSLQAAPTANARELLVTWQQPRIPAHGIPCSGTQLVPLSCPIFVGLDVVYGGSSLESYLVQYSDDSDFTGFNWLGVATTSALLQGLDSGKLYYVRVLTINSEGQKSDFCGRANSGGYLCPDNLVLLDGNIVTGPLVAATPA